MTFTPSFLKLRYLLICMLVPVAVTFSPACFALSLELTQGISNQLPIGVETFPGQPDGDVNGDISAIIRNDLIHSGQFKVFPLNAPTSISRQVSAVDLPDKRFDAIVVGHLQALDTGQYRLQFALNNLTQGGRQTLLQREFTVEKSQLRRLAHHLSDLIYEKLTGVKGVFSTQIAYVLVTRPDRRHRLFSLQVADMDGHNAKPLLTSRQPIMSPAWSHDGKRIAYVSFEKILSRVYIQTVSSGSRELVSSFPGINGAPAWSQDDQHLALALSKDSAAPKIYLMNLADKTLRQVTYGFSIDTEPSWSPDGRSLLFTSDRGGGPQIYRLDIRSGTIRRLSFDGDYNARASYSADGRMIVMLNRTKGSYNIAVQDLTDDNALQILTHSGYDASPSFSPNSQMVLYESKPDKKGFLGIVSADGRINLRLPAQQGDVQDPTWSPLIHRG